MPSAHLIVSNGVACVPLVCPGFLNEVMPYLLIIPESYSAHQPDWWRMEPERLPSKTRWTTWWQAGNRKWLPVMEIFVLPGVLKLVLFT